MCGFGSANLENLRPGIPLISPTTFKINIEMKCTNPNPYTISFEYSSKGGVFLGSGMTKVGDAMENPFSNSSLPAEGNGSVWASTEVSINAGVLTGVTGELITSSGVPLYVELNQKLGVSIRFFWGGDFKVSQSFEKDCGMKISGLAGIISTLKVQVGKMACADSFDALTVPALGGGTSDGNFHFSANDLDPEKIKQGKTAKDVGLGLAMGVTYCSAFVLLVTFCYLCRAICVGSKGQRYELKGAKEEDHESSSEGSPPEV